MNKGDRVTCRERVEAYYSNYGGNPECWFEPGDVGVVANTDVPAVIHIPGRPPTFCTVDFGKYGFTWRVSLTEDNMRRYD